MNTVKECFFDMTKDVSIEHTRQELEDVRDVFFAGAVAATMLCDDPLKRSAVLSELNAYYDEKKKWTR